MHRYLEVDGEEELGHIPGDISGAKRKHDTGEEKGDTISADRY